MVTVLGRVPDTGDGHGLLAPAVGSHNRNPEPGRQRPGVVLHCFSSWAARCVLAARGGSGGQTRTLVVPFPLRGKPGGCRL
jgi:hypothetical protein